ncbi:MAG TPA: hypothetical protein VGA56_26020 [Opitutaceae bacterium]
MPPSGVFAPKNSPTKMALAGQYFSASVCRNCSSTFGAEVDCKLLQDESIYRAAMEAGLTHDELLRNYEAIATTDSGRKVKLSVRDGVSRVIGSLAGPEPYIGTGPDGRLTDRQWLDFRGRLKAKDKVTMPRTNLDGDYYLHLLQTGRVDEVLAAARRSNPD